MFWVYSKVSYLLDKLGRPPVRAFLTLTWYWSWLLWASSSCQVPAQSPRPWRESGTTSLKYFCWSKLLVTRTPAAPQAYRSISLNKILFSQVKCISEQSRPLMILLWRSWLIVLSFWHFNIFFRTLWTHSQWGYKHRHAHAPQATWSRRARLLTPPTPAVTHFNPALTPPLPPQHTQSLDSCCHTSAGLGFWPPNWTRTWSSQRWFKFLSLSTPCHCFDLMHCRSVVTTFNMQWFFYNAGLIHRSMDQTQDQLVDRPVGPLLCVLREHSGKLLSSWPLPDTTWPPAATSWVRHWHRAESAFMVRTGKTSIRTTRPARQRVIVPTVCIVITSESPQVFQLFFVFFVQHHQHHHPPLFNSWFYCPNTCYLFLWSIKMITIQFWQLKPDHRCCFKGATGQNLNK